MGTGVGSVAAGGLSVMHVAQGGDALGGVRQHLLSLLPRLRADGVDARVVFLGEGRAADRARERGLPTLVIEKRGRADPGTIGRLARLLREHRPDIVHTHTLSTNLYGRWAARLAGIPRAVTTVHGLMAELNRQDPTGRLGNRVLLWHNRHLVRTSARTVAVAQRVSDWLVSWGIPASRITVIRCGLEVADAPSPTRRREVRAQWGWEDDAWVIGTVGRAVPVKHQAGLVEAAVPLLRADPRLRLAIIGDGPELPKLRSLAREHGVLGQVALPGAVPDAADLMPAFDVFALPSHAEGISLALLEAMLARLPVVATAVGGTPEVVTDGVTGLLVPPASPQPLREALHRLHADRELAGRLAAAGREAVLRDYDVRRTSAQLAALYRELLQSPRTHQPEGDHGPSA